MNKYKIIALASTLLIVLSLAIFALARPYRVSGDCMESAVKDGQLCFLNRMAPYLHKYRVDDIVLFNHDGKVWVSRIVALENDTIQIAERNVIVNGVASQNPQIYRNWENWRYGTYAVETSLQVPEGHVFVLSDNLSAHHDDSRVFGPISMESILGLIW